MFNENIVLSVESQKNPSVLPEPCGSGLDSCQFKEIAWHRNYCVYQNVATHLVGKKERKLLGLPKLSFHSFANDKDMMKKWIVKRSWC